MSGIIHFVIYSDGEPYNSTKKKLIKTIHKFTNRNVIIHDYDLDRMKKSCWYDKIKELPQVTGGVGRRDGYYCVYKAFIVNEVYENMNDGDILYHVDASRHFRTGFTENVDKLCDIVLKEGIIAGHVGKDVKNNSYGCCDNLDIWNKIIPNNDNSKLLDKMHLCSSWIILTKNNKNTEFMKEYLYWDMYTDNKLTRPLLTYHHTGDQSIFNILAYKYKFKVFYHEQIDHDANKDRNVVLKIINNSSYPEQYFIKLLL